MFVAHLKTNMGNATISTHRKDLCNLHKITFSSTFAKYRPRRYVPTCQLCTPAQKSSTKPHYSPLFLVNAREVPDVSLTLKSNSCVPYKQFPN